MRRLGLENTVTGETHTLDYIPRCVCDNILYYIKNRQVYTLEHIENEWIELELPHTYSARDVDAIGNCLTIHYDFTSMEYSTGYTANGYVNFYKWNGIVYALENYKIGHFTFQSRIQNVFASNEYLFVHAMDYFLLNFNTQTCTLLQTDNYFYFAHNKLYTLGPDLRIYE